MNNVSAAINGMNIKLRPDNRFEGRITIKGTRKSFYGATKAEVKQKAKEYLQKIENGYKEPKRITLDEYIQYWLVTYKLNKIEPSSYTRLYRVYECQLRNGIGKKMVGDITTKDIQKLIDERANPKDSTIRPLALSGLKRILHLLRPCLSMAVSEGIISINPCDNVILPIESCIETPTKEQTTMTDSEIAEFKKAVFAKYKTKEEYKSRDAFVLLVMLNTGLRVGEMLALEWGDINFNDKLMYIGKTVQSNIKNFTGTGNAQYSITKKSAKTHAGVRVIPLNDNVIGYLKELVEYDSRNGIQSKYVAATHNGTQNTARNLQRSLNRVLDMTSIRKNVTLHTLRHTFGSTMLRRGISIEVISKLMGHSNINITYTKYIHVIQEQKARAMQMVNIC